jgi:hypothetical protein
MLLMLSIASLGICFIFRQRVHQLESDKVNLQEENTTLRNDLLTMKKCQVLDALQALAMNRKVAEQPLNK